MVTVTFRLKNCQNPWYHWVLDGYFYKNKKGNYF